MITTSETAEDKLKEMIFHKLDFKHVDDYIIDLNGISVFIDPDYAARLGNFTLSH